MFYFDCRYIFLAIYSCEMFIKVIAKGFVLNKYTYLRNPWNWLDFVVITSGYATIGMEVGNLAGLRTFRVLRALKTVSIMPGRIIYTFQSDLSKNYQHPNIISFRISMQTRTSFKSHVFIRLHTKPAISSNSKF